MTIKDHKGNEYASLSEMCSHYGIKSNTYNARIKAGWSIESALTKEKYARSSKDIIKDSAGVVYKNKSELCREYGIKRSTYDARINAGWTLGEALGKNTRSIIGCGKKCRDHLNNKYESLSEMCSHYGISLTLYSTRIRRGWTVEDALTTPIRARHCKKKEGNK